VGRANEWNGKEKGGKKEKKVKGQNVCKKTPNQTGIKKELLTCCGRGKIIFLEWGGGFG
jgi:hypothetical protein